MKAILKTSLAAFVLFLAVSCKKENIVRNLSATDKSLTQDLSGDMEALASNTIKIGTQKWMAANLNIARYRNGDKIPQVKNPAAWETLTSGAWCYYNNDPANGAIYGKLYNWYAVNDPRGLAPIGYHIPSDAEWNTLSTFLGGSLIAGGKMKESGVAHWDDPNVDATNSSNFTGLPGGGRNSFGTFNSIFSLGCWWSSTEEDINYALVRFLTSSDGAIGNGGRYKYFGFSVRCVKD